MSRNLNGIERQPSWFRRIAALAYDALAVLALWFFATLIIVIARKGAAIDAGNPYYMLYLLGCAFAYCGYCWTHGGQTLGMKSWKIALAAVDRDQRIDWRLAAIRFGAALATLGLGYLWAALDRDRRTWHDRLSKTYVHNVD